MYFLVQVVCSSPPLADSVETDSFVARLLEMVKTQSYLPEKQNEADDDDNRSEDRDRRHYRTPSPPRDSYQNIRSLSVLHFPGEGHEIAGDVMKPHLVMKMTEETDVDAILDMFVSVSVIAIVDVDMVLVMIREEMHETSEVVVRIGTLIVERSNFAVIMNVIIATVCVVC